MRIAILNGDPSPNQNQMNGWLRSYENSLVANGHQVEHFHLSEMNLHHCIGCWTCWWKTPGRCVHNDDGEQVFRTVINADFFVFASPLIAGFTSALLKTITDRFVVLIHPYIEIRLGELHHRKRYDKYPNFGLILSKEADTDEEDLRIVRDMYDRLAINFHAKMLYMNLVEEHNPEETAYVTTHH